jgi:hypothetical protein
VSSNERKSASVEKKTGELGVAEETDGIGQLVRGSKLQSGGFGDLLAERAIFFNS